jgi:PAS domain S-box-containing protein
MWEKIVLNLLSNAFKFTFEGEISVTLHAAEAVAQLTVRDTGVGIASGELPHVFERFHRAYASRSRSKEGSGIGLALVQELVRFHHGEITVESTPAVGTTFIVSIPLGTAHLPPDKLKTTATMVSGALGAAPYVEEVLNWLPAVNSPVPVGASLEFTGNDTIPRIDQPVTDYVLVVDDNPDMGAYIRRLLQERFIVELVTDGQQALSRVENRLPGLILSDIMMPNLDGLQLLHQIRANPMAKSTPFIVLSARAGDETRTKALQEGADDYIIKPFTAGELVARIETHLKIARLRKELLDQERQLRLRTEQILESISDAFYTVDSDWRFIYVNQKAADLWNKERSALIGQNIWEALPLAYGNETYVALHEAVAEQKPRRFETFGPYTHTWFTVTAFPTPTELSVYFSEITEQKRIENFQRFLINAGVALSSSLDYEETFQKVANLAIPDLADGCIIESVDENHVLQLIANAHVDPAKVEVISDLRQRYPISLEQDGYSAALAHQKSQLMSEMSNGENGLSDEHRRQLQRYEALGVRSFILVPIIGVDKVSVLGAITFIISETDRHYQADDLLLVEELARRAAVAIENSKLYREAQDQRQRFQVTLASIGDAVIATDVDSRITFMNNSAETLTGWSVADAIDRELSQVFQIVGERSRTRVENPVASVLQQRKTVGLANHTILIAKDGTEHFIDHSAAPIKDQNGDILGVILIFRDITQRRYTENILENTLIRTQDLYHVSHQIGLANSSRGVLQALFQSETLRSVNQAAIITFSNSMPVDPEMIAATPYEIAAAIPEQLRLPGLLGQPQLVNEPLVELFLSAKKPVYIADIGLHDTISESLRGLFYESDVKSIALIPLQANEAWIGLLLLYCQHRHSWTADDIRQLQIFSEQISVAIRNIQLLVTEEAARREAEKANQIKMEFLGMISHELRTPLAVIKGFTSTILSTDVTWDAQNQQNFIAIIDEETNKLTDLVAQLLELSQLTAGRLRVHIAPHPVQDIVNFASTQFAAVISEHTLKVEIPSDLSPVMVDIRRIAQVINNLIGNAVKYSPPHTTIQLSAKQIGKQVQIDVRDEGFGIKPEDRLRVFEAFQQLDTIGITQKSGAGLGLAICKGLIEAHNGKIWVADKPAPGTTISFTVSCMDSDNMAYAAN